MESVKMDLCEPGLNSMNVACSSLFLKNFHLLYASLLACKLSGPSGGDLSRKKKKKVRLS